ncbi:MAG: ABC transporter permease [Candidatus Omnitrophica bacterium]|nr:ABC transporter permease [Candidatus Omnitrophota bacterium]
MINFLENIGQSLKDWITVFVDITKLFFETVYWAVFGIFHHKPVNFKTVFEQMVYMGVQSVMIVFFVTFFTGVVIAMQLAPQFQKMGAVFYVSSMVSIAICRELGPVLTALVIAGRIGAAITAEVGSMKVNEQIEALETMGINPVRYLAVPKFLALLVMLPCLTVLGDASGMFGGYVVGTTSLHINPGMYIQTTFKFLSLKDIYTGVSKPFVFAAIISMVGIYQGFKTRGGAVGVGKATTTSVVTSFIFIIIADCVLTGIYFFVKF